MSRVDVKKTYKLFIGGKFPRSESGRALKIKDINYSHASRKDLRNAVVAAEKAQNDWQSATPYLRGQILYRSAEMLETRKAAFSAEIVLQTGVTSAQANREVEASIDRLVWYAGWSDKFAQIFGSVNPVGLPFFNITAPEPMGIVGIVAPEEAPLLGLVSKIAPAIVSGNAVVVIASEKAPLTAISFGEVLATSDLPGGVVNILSGEKKELLSVLADHMGVKAIDYSGNQAEQIQMLQSSAAKNLKRIIIRETPRTTADWQKEKNAQSPYWIADLCEMKTAWHPIGV